MKTTTTCFWVYVSTSASVNSNRMSVSTISDDAASLASSSSQLPVGLVSPIKEKKVHYNGMKCEKEAAQR